MKRHPTDTLSLVFGLIFLGIAGLWVVDLFVELDIPHLGWIAALGLIVLGVLGVAASLRGGGDTTADATTSESATEATGPATWTDRGEELAP